ncbi:dentin sialophosphoprotein-like [Trichoplusia ni]|uniref:Dentin sialophosphoprotein-like n=1 Tax=Trichoplusia ni TaxID=7111 RepID=A0A7E5W277_TRINI|nr:dentin sialophosphoprotein-like [Trichoplusia ni]
MEFFFQDFNDPYHVFHEGGDRAFDLKPHPATDPTRNQPAPRPSNGNFFPNLNHLGIKKDNEYANKLTKPLITGQGQPGEEENFDGGEVDDKDSRSWSSESRESGSRSGESGSRSGESGSWSGEDSGEDIPSEHGYHGNPPNKHNSREQKGPGLPLNRNTEVKDQNNDIKKNFDQILSDLHKIFVRNNASVIIPDNNPNLVGNKDAIAGGNNDTKKANMISVLEGLFTNIIRNTIIVNNNVPVVQNPGTSNPNVPQRLHDPVDTTTNSNTDLTSLKDTTDNPKSKPDISTPDAGKDSKNFGVPDEVTTFNKSKLPNIDGELNKNKTLDDKSPSSTEKPNKNETNIDDEKKLNSTDKGDEKASDDSKKSGNVTGMPVDGLKDNEGSGSDKDNIDTSRKNKNFDQIVDLINNDKFWKFMGDLSAKYLETVIERTQKLMNDEIKAQIDKYFKEHKSEVNKDIQPKKDEATNTEPEKANNVVEKTNEANTTENPVTSLDDSKDKKAKDTENSKQSDAKKDKAKETNKKDIVNVKSHTIYGNAVGNDKVTNIYVFYASKNLDAIIKHIKDLVNGNSTNIFSFEHGHKVEDKHTNEEHNHGTDNTGTVTEANIEPVTNNTNTPDATTTDVGIKANKDEVTTESSNSGNVTEKAGNDVTSKPSATLNNVTTEAVTSNNSTEKPGNNSVNDSKPDAGKDDKKTDGNANSTTTEPSKANESVNGTQSPNTTVSSEKDKKNATDTVESSTEKGGTDPAQVDATTSKPNVTENKAENATAAVEPAKNLTESGNDTKVTPEKDLAGNKTADSNAEANNKTAPLASNSTSTDIKPGNATDLVETPKNATVDIKNDAEKNNGTGLPAEGNQDKASDEHKDSKDNAGDKKDTVEVKDKKESSGNEGTTETSVNKDFSSKKPDETSTEKSSS